MASIGCAKQRREMHTAGELQHVRTAVTYDMTSLKLFSFPNVEKSCFLSVQCRITIVALWKYFGEIRKRIKEFQSDLETLAKLRTNVTMADAFSGKIYFAFLIHVANEIQLSSIYLLIACFDLRKIF